MVIFSASKREFSKSFDASKALHETIYEIIRNCIFEARHDSWRRDMARSTFERQVVDTPAS